MSQQLDYGTVKITIITGWIRSPGTPGATTSASASTTTRSPSSKPTAATNSPSRTAPSAGAGSSASPATPTSGRCTANDQRPLPGTGTSPAVATRTLYQHGFLGAYRSGSRLLSQPPGMPRTPAWLPTPVYAATMPPTIAPVVSTSPPARTHAVTAAG